MPSQICVSNKNVVWNAAVFARLPCVFFSVVRCCASIVKCLSSVRLRPSWPSCHTAASSPINNVVSNAVVLRSSSMCISFQLCCASIVKCVSTVRFPVLSCSSSPICAISILLLSPIRLDCRFRRRRGGDVDLEQVLVKETLQIFHLVFPILYILLMNLAFHTRPKHFPVVDQKFEAFFDAFLRINENT
jgi:hypothetical protein